MIAKNAILYKTMENTFKKNYLSFVYRRHVISCTFFSNLLIVHTHQVSINYF